MKKVIGAAVLLIVLTGLILFVKINGSGWVCQNGQWVKQGTALAPKPTTPCGQEAKNQTPTAINQVQNQTSTLTPSPTVNPSGNIVIDNPKSGEALNSQFVIKGKARVFENQLNFRIRDSKGNPIIEGTIMATSQGAGQFANFETTVSSVPSGKVTIEVFDKSAKDGSEIDKVSISVNVK
jgi:hypothetical protein